MGIKILGMGCYLPEQKLTNDDFTRFVDTNDEWIRTRTGITERRMAGWEPTWYMGKEAGISAIKKAGIDPEDIGARLLPTSILRALPVFFSMRQALKMPLHSI